MTFRALRTTLVGLSLVAAPAIVAATPVQTPLTDPSTETAESVAGISLADRLPILLAALGAIGAGIAAGAGGDDGPNSP